MMVRTLNWRRDSNRNSGSDWSETETHNKNWKGNNKVG